MRLVKNAMMCFVKQMMRFEEVQKRGFAVKVWA